MKRSSTERIADLEAKAAKLRAESERRLSVASDPFCSMAWDCEKALRSLAAYCGLDGKARYAPIADNLAHDREDAWAAIKEKGAQ
jgi:phage terminase small subunit